VRKGKSYLMSDSDFFVWRRDILASFNAITQSNDICQLINEQIQLLEFDAFGLCIRHPLPFTRPKYTIMGTYSQAFVEHYQEQNFFSVDPILKKATGRVCDIIWNDALFADCPELSHSLIDYGMKAGRTLSAVTSHRVSGFLSLAKSTERVNGWPEDELSARLNFLTELTLATLVRVEDPAMVGLDLRLSRREREIIQWTGEGKTSAEIAIILSISENTVNFHQKNMQKKLNASNKTQIASYAAALGLI